MIQSMCTTIISASSGTEMGDAVPVIDVSDTIVIDGTEASCKFYNDKLSALTAGDGFSVFVHFKQTGGAPAALFSISNNGNQAEYFTLYVNGARLGFEFRNVTNGWSYSRYADNVLNSYGENTVAFVADPDAEAYYLYANGEKVFTLDKTVDSSFVYKKLSDINPAVNTVCAGMVKRAVQSAYSFKGEIYALKVYDKAVSKETITAYDKSLVINADDPVYINGNGETAVDYSNRLSRLTASDGFSVLCQFAQTGGSGAQTLFSISNANYAGNHFHIYVNGATIGYEFRMNDGADNIRASKTDVARKNGVNSVAFVSDPTAKCFYLYLNGQLIDTQELGDSYKKLSDISGLNTIKVGMTQRRSDMASYNFTGYVADLKVYNRSVSESDATKYTSETALAEGTKQPFEYNSDFSIQNFRIPCLLTLNNGDILAVTDLRSHMCDAPNNIEIGIRILDSKTGEWGDPIISHSFDDYAYNVQSWYSASFIDAAVVQTEGGRIFMLVDAMPAYAGGGIGGLFNGMVTVDGNDYYALTMGDSTLTTGYDYYMYPNENSEHDYDRYIVKKVSDSSDTEFTLDGYFNVYKNGESLTVKQRTVEYGDGGLEDIVDPKVETDVDVKMNIFYDASCLKLYRTSYFYLNYSDDNGRTWSEPTLVGSEYRKAGENIFNKAPGVGTVIKSGEYAGRILFPLYHGNTTTTVSCLYSDDNGKTWKMSADISMGESGATGANEAQVVEMPDGSLRVYARNNLRYVIYADSIDGGATWSDFKKDEGLYYCGENMISAISYPTKIDGKDAIIMSYAAGYDNGNENDYSRANGVIKIGLITENDGYDAPGYGRYSIEWKYTYAVNNSFWYSCLAPIENGVALLYEYAMPDKHYNGLCYTEVSIDTIKDPTDLVDSFEIDSVEGEEITVVLRLKDKVFSKLSALDDATVEVRTLGVSATLGFYKLSDDGKTVYFKATLPGGVSKIVDIQYGKDNKIFTLSGSVSADSVENGGYVYAKTVERVELNNKSELIVIYTDGTSENLGVVKGNDAVTPRLRVNETSNEWEISYDNDETWTSLGVKATGAPGTDGKDGVDGTNGKDGGCGSVIGGTAIALTATLALGAGITFKKKEDQ